MSDDESIHIEASDGDGTIVNMEVTDPELIDKINQGLITSVSIAYLEGTEQFIASKIFPTALRPGQPGYESWAEQRAKRNAELKAQREAKQLLRDSLHTWMTSIHLNSRSWVVIRDHQDQAGTCSRCTIDEDDGADYLAPWPCDYIITVAYLAGYDPNLYDFPERWRP